MFNRNCLRHGIQPLGQLAFQVAGFVLMYNATFCQLVDHRDHFRSLFTRSGLVAQSLEVTDGITGSFSVIAVSVAALGRLTHIFLCSLMISHEFSIWTAKVREKEENLFSEDEIFFSPRLFLQEIGKR